MTNLVRRVAAAEATLAAFRDKPLVWGVCDCARMAAFTARQLGVRAPLSRFGRYSTAAGAQRALKRQGFDTLAEAVDSLGLLRIPPAAALPADLIALDAEDGGVALTVHLAHDRVLGFAELDGRHVAGVLKPTGFVCAWRVI
jgi:hypothetical protein